MIDINFIREYPEKIKESVRRRGVNVSVDKILELDEKRRALIPQIEELRAERNKLSSVQVGKPDPKAIDEAKKVKSELKLLEPELEKIEQKLEGLLLEVPNLLHPSVPDGKDENDNVELRAWGGKPEFDFEPKDHLEIGEALDIIDVKTAAKITGSRFGYLKGGAALLEFALIQYALNILIDKEVLGGIAEKVEPGYNSKPFIPVIPPVMIKEESYRKMARLYPKEERYYIPSDNLYLIGSAEHTLGPIHIDEILEQGDLPIRYVGFSTAFRREAGSYGKDTRGIFRVHQFDKVEMESFTLPENSVKEQDFFVGIQEYLMQSLKIPYRVVSICTGDMGDPDYRQLDLEAWLPGQGRYRETHTADLMTDYQARRLNTKVRRGNKTEFVHMNDATAFAIGRTIIAILENYQQADGSVKIPEVLQKYTGFKEIIK